MSDQELQDAVEEMIDGKNLSAVLGAIASVCYGKAEHLRANWQDGRSAKWYESIGRKIDRLSVQAV